MSLSSTLLAAALLVAGAGLSATAQTATAAAPPFQLTCDNDSWSGQSANKRFCETRDLTLDLPPAGQPLTVDGGTNGGISVRGWDGPNVRVRAKVQSWDETAAAAQTQVQAVRIETQNHTLRAAGPAGAGRSHQRWSVSYEVFVPRQTALVLHTVNGGISVEDVQAAVRFDAVNGGIALANLGGQVAGHTVNGGVSIRLSGRQWAGAGLDVQTTNGGISWDLPRDYSAQFFTSTNVGSISTSLPVTKSGYVHREVSTTLGRGGAPLKAVTTNGGISVRQAEM